MKLACGIDIGGSGVKGALVDLTTGTYSGESVLIKTPSPATPDAVAQVCGQVLETLGVTPEIPVGITFPAPIVHGRVPFMANLDPSWAGIDVVELMDRHLGRTIVALNDADAAGLGEAIYGAARGVPGVVIVTTLGARPPRGRWPRCRDSGFGRPKNSTESGLGHVGWSSSALLLAR